MSEKQDADGFWTVSTQRGDIKAKNVIFATNAYTSAILPQYTDHITPVRGICSRIVTKKQPAPLLTNSYTLRWSSWSYDYLIPRTDGSIVVGGARPHYLHDLKNWWNVTDDGKLMENTKQYFDGYMQRHFRGWEDSEAYTDQVWTGSESNYPSPPSLPLLRDHKHPYNYSFLTNPISSHGILIGSPAPRR